MEKGNLISKLNIKDYSKMLEEILAIKPFSKDAKNLLLSMLYKIENSYLDYKKVKVNVQPKKEILEEVIQAIKTCEDIKIIKPKTKKEDLKQCKIDYEKKEIETYPNEMAMLYALYRLNEQKMELIEEDDITTLSINNVLNDGIAIEISEIIRDFDGWAWHINKNNIEDIFTNFMYQTINSVADIKSLKRENFIYNFNEELLKKAGEKTLQKYIELFIKLSMQYMVIENKEEKKRLNKIQNKIKEELEIISDKKAYLAQITENKKQIQKELAKLEVILNDDIMLKTKYLNTNKQLPPEEKIFSLSDFSEIQEKRKQFLIQELEEYNKKQDPKHYLNLKEELENKIDLLNSVIKQTKEEISNDILDFIKLNIKILRNITKKVETKKEILDLIYKIRYYKKVPVNNIENVGDIKEIDKEFEKLEMQVITAACNLNVLNIITPDIKENYKIIQSILDVGIIDLERIQIEAKREKKLLLINIYEDKTFEKEIRFNDVSELNIKLNKKIKLFS